MNDLISRQAALDAMETWDKFGCDPDGKLVRYDDDKHYIPYVHYEDMVHAIKHLPSAQPEVLACGEGELIAQPEQRWIPFKTRPLTKEEKEEYPEWDCILDCKLPDNGQRILVAIRIRGHEEVQQDGFYSDDDSYLDSGYEIGTEAVAWMPLPEPYKAESEDKE